MTPGLTVVSSATLPTTDVWGDTLARTDEAFWDLLKKARPHRLEAVGTSTGPFAPEIPVEWHWRRRYVTLHELGHGGITSTPALAEPHLVAVVARQAPMFSFEEPARYFIAEIRNDILHGETAQAEEQASRGLVHRIEGLFDLASEEVFESGEETDFSRSLTEEVKQHGKPVVEIVQKILEPGRPKPDVVFETLKLMGRISHPQTYRDRFLVLVQFLTSMSRVARDGAGLGLAFLDDPDAIPYLETAIQREEQGPLRDDLTKVLRQLKQHQSATAA